MPRAVLWRLVAAAPPVVTIAVAWASLELRPDRRVFAAVAVVALACALPGTTRRRVGLAVLVLAVLAPALVGPSPAALTETAREGFRQIFSVAPPVDAALAGDLHVLMVLAAGAFAVSVAVTAGTRPFVAAVVTSVGVGWPVALQPSRNTIHTGVILLFAALWPVIVGARRDRRGIAPGTRSGRDRRRSARPWSRAPGHARRPLRSTGRTGTSSAASALGRRLRSSGTPVTRASTSRVARQPS